MNKTVGGGNEGRRKVICFSSMGKDIGGSVRDENLRNIRIRAMLDTDDGKSVFVEFWEDEEFGNAFRPGSRLRLQSAYIDTGDPNDPSKNSFLHYVSTGGQSGSVNLIVGGRSLGRWCDNDKESICKYVNETFNCSYDGAEVLPIWAKRRDWKSDAPVEYDHGYYSRMQDAIDGVERLYEAKAVEVASRHVSPLSIREHERNILEMTLGCTDGDFKALCGRTREEIAMSPRFKTDGNGGNPKFYIDTSDPNYMTRLPFVEPFENIKGHIQSLRNCDEVLYTVNQYNYSREALAIDHGNKQFALYDGMQLGHKNDNSKKSTHKEVRDRLRLMVSKGYTEARINSDAQIDYRLYVPELRKEMEKERRAVERERAKQLKESGVEAVPAIDMKRAVESTKGKMKTGPGKHGDSGLSR